MLVRVTHAIDYRFDQRVALANLLLRLSPRAEQGGVRHHQVVVDPTPQTSADSRDAFDNVVRRVETAGATSALSIGALTTLDMPASRERGQRDDELAMLLGTASPQEPRKRMRGRCRDLSERAFRTATARGFACRFVSGYHLGQSGPTDLHMWISVRVDREHWIDWDPSDATPADEHLVIARGATPEDVAPISGSTLSAARFRLLSHVMVERDV